MVSGEKGGRRGKWSRRLVVMYVGLSIFREISCDGCSVCRSWRCCQDVLVRFRSLSRQRGAPVPQQHVQKLLFSCFFISWAQTFFRMPRLSLLGFGGGRRPASQSPSHGAGRHRYTGPTVPRCCNVANDASGASICATLDAPDRLEEQR